jgi:uncharacterized protein YggL (DUF469 family)
MSKAIELTFTQCKQLIEKDIDLRDFIESIENQPTFIKSMGAIDSISELQAIQEGGCASGAYMPAVTYHTANKCMTDHSDEVETLLVQHGVEAFTFNPETDSWYCFASKLVSAAVELWVNQFDLDGVDWD